MNTDSDEAQQRAEQFVGTAQDNAGNIVDDAQQKAREVKHAATAEAKSVADEAKSHAMDVGHTAQRKLKGHVEEQATAAGRGLKDVGTQMLQMAEGTEQEGVVAELVGALGGQIDRIADTLENGGLDEVIGEVKQFARRRPGLFLLGAAAAGFASSRIVKLTDVDPQRLVPNHDEITEDGAQTPSDGSSKLSGGVASEFPGTAPSDIQTQPSATVDAGLIVTSGGTA